MLVLARGLPDRAIDRGQVAEVDGDSASSSGNSIFGGLDADDVAAAVGRARRSRRGRRCRCDRRGDRCSTGRGSALGQVARGAEEDADARAHRGCQRRHRRCCRTAVIVRRCSRHRSRSRRGYRRAWCRSCIVRMRSDRPASSVVAARSWASSETFSAIEVARPAVDAELAERRALGRGIGRGSRARLRSRRLRPSCARTRRRSGPRSRGAAPGSSASPRA